MISSLVNAVLFVALVSTSLIVAVMYRKLKAFESYHGEYKAMLDKTGTSLIAAQDAVSAFGTEGKATLIALDARIKEANMLIARIEAERARPGT